jgi:hypothetical protein
LTFAAGLIAGLFIGAFIGVIVLSLLVISRRGGERDGGDE